MNKQGNKFACDRIAQQISKSLAVVLQRKARDPRLGMVSINDVRVTRDLSVAKIYVTQIGGDTNMQIASVLNKMAGFLRTELASTFTSRSVPELRFYDDTLQESSIKLENLFTKIHKESDEQ